MKYEISNWQACGARQPDIMGDRRSIGRMADATAKTRGGQPRYSDLAVETVLTLGCVFGLRLRQSEGLVLSLLDLMGLDLPVPDHTTLSRRAQRWESSNSWQSHPKDGPLHVLVDSTGLSLRRRPMAEDKHGARSRRAWRKLHLALVLVMARSSATA